MQALNLYRLTNTQGHNYCLLILVSLMLMQRAESADAFGPYKVMISANASDLFIPALSPYLCPFTIKRSNMAS